VFNWQQGFVTFASALAAIAINALWQDALLVICVWLLLRAWPKINAATRYTVWSATLVAAIGVPVATTIPFFTTSQTAVASRSNVSVERAQSRLHARAHSERGASSAISSAAPSAALQTHASLTPRLPERMRFTIPLPLSLAVFGIWLALALYALVRLAIGLARLEQLKRDALPLPVEYRDAMPQWLRANKGARDVRLCVSDETDVPVAVGLFDAMILIPRSLLDRLSEPEVDQICLHELAHLRRADDWTNGAQRLIAALLGWNPAAQFIGQQLDLEREVACDDWVLSFVEKVRPYALCLTKMAESASWPRHAIPAPGVFATRKHISLRIERLLAVGRNMATNLAVAPAAAAIAVVGAIALAITAVTPSIAAPCLNAMTVAIAPPSPAPATKPVKEVAMQSVRVAATAANATVPAAHAAVSPTHVTVPETRLTLPATHVSVPATHVTVPATHVTVPATHVNIPATNVTVPMSNVSVPAMKFTVAGTTVELPKIDIPSISTNTSRFAHSIAQAYSERGCNGCDYRHVDWSGRDLHGVNYTGVDLTGAKLVGTNFSGGNFNGVDFTRADLRNASFRNANLTGCDFSETDLTGADFTGARIEGCQFVRARLTAAQLRDVLNTCKGCDFTHADMRGLDLQGIRTSGNDFSNADLRNANLSGANITGSDFTHAHLDGANLAGATLNGCDLSGVDLRHVDLSRTKMISTDLSNDSQ
jgi:uncharacterized protein YjbI with pentapeptide repeats/beta-lactamase regulating signal transducer with metallopeptidase domain